MLDTINIPVSQIFDVKQRGSPDDLIVLGYIYCFRWGEFLKACVHAGEAVDSFLSKYLLGGLTDEPPEQKTLILYYRMDENFYLSVCNQAHQPACRWLERLPGHLIEDQPYNGRRIASGGIAELHEDAIPLFYWDGKKAFRTYPLPQDYADGDYLMCDWGHDSGQLHIGHVTEDIYRAVREHPKHYTCFSPIPVLPEQKIMVKKIEYDLHSVFYQFSQ